MKNILKAVTLITMGLIFLAGCKKDENRIYFEGGTPSVLKASATTVILTPATEANEAIRFNWTNPQYKFTTGLSSQDVQYALEFDINSNFSSAKKYVTTVAKDLGRNFTVLELNKILGNEMLLPFGVNATIYARIVSTLRFEGSTNGALASNTVTFNATPFAPPPAVEPPSTGKLVLVGSGSPGGWDNNTNNTQVFTKVSNTLYELTINLNGGGSVLFLPVPGSWDVKYGWAGGNNANNVTGDKLQMGGGDIKVPATSGSYKISVDFQIGRFTITPQ